MPLLSKSPDSTSPPSNHKGNAPVTVSQAPVSVSRSRPVTPKDQSAGGTSKKAGESIRMPSPPMTRTQATAAAEVAQISGTSSSSPLISPSISNSVVAPLVVLVSLATCSISPPPAHQYSILSISPFLLYSVWGRGLASLNSASPLQSTVEALLGFRLSIWAGGGLPEPPALSTRGRKSNLSKAIQKAGVEVVSGKQSTMEGVLRALKASGGVPP